MTRHFEGNAVANLADALSGALAETGSAATFESVTLTGEDALMLTGDGIVYNDVLPYAVNPGTGKTGLASGQYGTTGFTLYKWEDSNVDDQTVQVFFQLPHWYKEGTDVELHIHTIPASTIVSGNVRMTVEWQWVNIGGTYDTATNESQPEVLAVTSAMGNTHKTFGFAPFSGTGKTISSDLMVQITRNSDSLPAIDTYTADLWLRFIDLHVQMDALGSEDQYTKQHVAAGGSGQIFGLLGITKP